MANAHSTAGMTVKYCIEATAGTRPTSGYTEIVGCKVLPAFGSEKNMLDSTPLSATKNHTYVEGLNDPGGALQINVNDAAPFRTAYDACVTAYAGLTGGKQMWFEFCYPEDSDIDSFYFPGQPLTLGFNGAEVDSVLENVINIAPEGDYLFAEAST